MAVLPQENISLNINTHILFSISILHIDKNWIFGKKSHFDKKSHILFIWWWAGNSQNGQKRCLNRTSSNFTCKVKNDSPNICHLSIVSFNAMAAAWNRVPNFLVAFQLLVVKNRRVQSTTKRGVLGVHVNQYSRYIREGHKMFEEPLTRVC